MKPASMSYSDKRYLSASKFPAMELGKLHWGHGPIIICSHDDPGLTLTYFMARSNLAPWEKCINPSSKSFFFFCKLAPFGHSDKTGFHSTLRLCTCMKSCRKFV